MKPHELASRWRETADAYKATTDYGLQCRAEALAKCAAELDVAINGPPRRCDGCGAPTHRRMFTVAHRVAWVEDGYWRNAGLVEVPLCPTCLRHEDLTKLAHANEAHPDFEYTTTDAPRKCGVVNEPDGDGWHLNDDHPSGGWERLEYFELTYWRRRRPAPGEAA